MIESTNKPEKLALSNLCNGAIAEVFQAELDKVLDNIADVNTEAEKTRKIVLTLEFKPGANRQGMSVGFGCRSMIQPIRKVTGEAFLVKEGTAIVAYPQNPLQMTLQEMAEDAEAKKLTALPGGQSTKR